MITPDETRIWGPGDRVLALMARNISTRYLAIAVDGVIGLVMMPFNVAHLGPSAYGLWALTTSITFYFSVLDLGYGGALVKFIAQYRALRNQRALNEVLSTVFVVYAGVGVATFVVTAGMAWQFGRFFKVTPDQIATGRSLLLVTGAFIAIRFPASIFGAVVVGFQRYYLNNLISICSSICVALVTYSVLSGGADLVTLVMSTTAVRILTLGGFLLTGYRVYPGLHVSAALFRRARLREVTGFSIYILVLDWSAKLNFSTDTLVIGAMMSTAAVTTWTVGQRVAQLCSQITSQLSSSLFPIIVDSDAANRQDRLRALLIHGTSLSLALGVPICTGIWLLSGPIITAWMGPRFEGSVIVLRLLLARVLLGVLTSSCGAILRGAGQHRRLAATNSIAAVANLLLSIALVKPLGLTGVALGTLIPLTTAAVAVVIPSACARVGVSVWTMWRQAVWPAVWPAAGLAAVVWAGWPFAGSTLPGLAGLLVVAGLVYQALFVGVAIPARQRSIYWSKLSQLAGRGWRAPAAA